MLVNCILIKSPTVVSDVYAQISLTAGLITFVYEMRIRLKNNLKD